MIVCKDGQFEFIKVDNIYTGKPEAAENWSPNPVQLGEKVLSKVVEGYAIIGSVHSHPGDCVFYGPSETDLKYLFPYYQVNFIVFPKTGLLMEFHKNSKGTWKGYKY